MKFSLERNAILCLNESWIKYKEAENDESQYLFSFKELASFIEIYCKFLIKQYLNPEISDTELQNIKSCKNAYNKVGSYLKNGADKASKDKIEKLRKIRGDLMHFEYHLNRSEIVMFLSIIKSFDSYINNHFKNTLRDSCARFGFKVLYEDIMNIYLYEKKEAIKDNDWERLIEISDKDELKDIYESNHNHISSNRIELKEEYNYIDDDKIEKLTIIFMARKYKEDSDFILELYEPCEDIAYGHNYCRSCDGSDSLSYTNNGIQCVICFQDAYLTNCNQCNELMQKEYEEYEDGEYSEISVVFCSDGCKPY